MPGKHVKSKNNRTKAQKQAGPAKEVGTAITLSVEKENRRQERLSSPVDSQAIFRKANPIVDILTSLNDSGDEAEELPYFALTPVDDNKTPGFQPVTPTPDLLLQEDPAPVKTPAPPRKKAVKYRRLRTLQEELQDASKTALRALSTEGMLENILVKLSDAELRTAALVNHAWSAIATPLLWEDVSVNALERILLTVPSYYGESKFITPPDWTRFNMHIAPCIRTLRIDSRSLYDSLLLRELLDNMGKFVFPRLRELEVSLHGYDRYQIELAIRFASEGLTACRFVMHFKSAPTAATRDILKTFHDRAYKRMPNLEEFKLVPVWEGEGMEPSTEEKYRR